MPAFDFLNYRPDIVFKAMMEYGYLTDYFAANAVSIGARNQGVGYPAAMIRQMSNTPLVSKDGEAQDIARIELTIYDTNLENCTSLAEQCRSILSWTLDGLSFTDYYQVVQECHIKNDVDEPLFNQLENDGVYSITQEYYIRIERNII